MTGPGTGPYLRAKHPVSAQPGDLPTTTALYYSNSSTHSATIATDTQRIPQPQASLNIPGSDACWCGCEALGILPGLQRFASVITSSILLASLISRPRERGVPLQSSVRTSTFVYSNLADCFSPSNRGSSPSICAAAVPYVAAGS